MIRFIGLKQTFSRMRHKSVTLSSSVMVQVSMAELSYAGHVGWSTADAFSSIPENGHLNKNGHNSR